MSIDFRAELQKLVQAYDEHGGQWPEHHADALCDAVEHARAQLIPVSERLPDPTPEMLTSPEFEAVWQCIKTWDIAVPSAYFGYTGAQGNHVRAILDALSSVAIDRADAALAQSVAVSEKQLEDRFAAWWHDDGSGMPPLADEERCEHVKRIANIAWHNGADVARHG